MTEMTLFNSSLKSEAHLDTRHLDVLSFDLSWVLSARYTQRQWPAYNMNT